MESQSSGSRRLSFCEAEDDDSSNSDDGSQDPSTSSRRPHRWMSTLKQPDSHTAAALLLLRQRQIALGDMFTGTCLKCITADVEDNADSEDEEDLTDLINKRKITVSDYVTRKHLLRPMRTESQKYLFTRLGKRFPLTKLFTEGRWHNMLSDIIAGATVTVMGVPESLAYAEIAGVPHVYGLYALVMPQLVYSFLGMSNQLMVGPVAMISLLLHDGLEGSMDQYQCPLWHNQTHGELQRQRNVCQEKYVDLAILQSLLCGCFLTLFCVLQLGFLLKFLGHPVISGFSSGSAIVIMLHQLKNFVGYEVASSEFPILKMWAYASKARDVQPITLAFGLAFTICLILLRKTGVKCGCKLLGSLGPLLSCVIGVLLLYWCKPLQHVEGLDFIGDIPGGSLPSSLPMFSRWTWKDVKGSLPLSGTIALIGFLEAFATAQNLAKQHGDELSSSQELLALGFSNLLGSLCSSYPASGSFSRSAVCNSSGGVSQLSGLVAVALSLLVLMYLTQLFYYLPKFVLGAIVVSSVSKLIAYDVAIALFIVKKSDFAMWMAAFIGTLCMGPLLGIGVAVLLSLSVVIYESVHPPITVLWRIQGTNSYRPIQHNPGGMFVEGVFIVRIGATMYFANVAYVEETLRTLIADMDAISRIKYLVLDFTPVTTADFSAVEALSDVVENFRERGIQVAFSCLGPRLEGVFERFGLMESLREDWCFTTVHAAVMHCAYHAGMDMPSLEEELEAAVKDLDTKVNEVSLAKERVDALRTRRFSKESIPSFNGRDG